MPLIFHPNEDELQDNSSTKNEKSTQTDLVEIVEETTTNKSKFQTASIFVFDGICEIVKFANRHPVQVMFLFLFVCKKYYKFVGFLLFIASIPKIQELELKQRMNVLLDSSSLRKLMKFMFFISIFVAVLAIAMQNFRGFARAGNFASEKNDFLSVDQFNKRMNEFEERILKKVEKRNKK
jgi:hypothetical protein